MSASKHEKALRLAELTGTTGEVLGHMIKGLSASAGPEGQTIVKAFFNQFDFDYLKAAIAEVLVEQLDDNTLDAVLTFYESEAGLRWTRSAPAFVRRGFEIGNVMMAKIEEGNSGR